MSDFLSYCAQITPLLLQGALVTVELFACTLILSLPLGLPIALGEQSRILPIRWICQAYVFVFRGTPLMLQLMFFYFLIPLLFGIGRDWDPFTVAVLAFVLNYAAYFAEIYRGGLNSIDKGQYEAAHSLGLSKARTMMGVILPQTFRVVLPPISNESIVLVKDTALASVISLNQPELMHVSEGLVNRSAGNVTPYLLAAVIYLIFTFLLTKLLRYFEKKYSSFAVKED
ncbi:MAG: amino acid ABC transporter permease [Anaerovoracaceae bacterium]|jgi:polar amino acid transport system permease protein